MWAALAAQAVPAVLGSGGGGGVLGGLLGGGKTEVTQNSSNTTSLNITSLLSNQSPNASGGDASGQASGSAQSASGSDAPLLPSPYATPYDGFGSLGAEDEFNASVQPDAVPKQLIYASAALVAGLGAFALFNRRKKRR